MFSWGLAGCLVGAQLASGTWPAMSGLAACLRSVLEERAAMRSWRIQEVGWRDYDLVTGPSGIALALATDPTCSPASVSPVGAHLAALCDTDDLERLRVGVYRGETLRGWNYGRINTGLAHGVAGVVAALRTIADVTAAGDEITMPLRRAARWLVRQSFTDARGVLTWPSAARDGRAGPSQASRRQAWCYGTPGVAWSLWEAGRVLDDPELQSFALDAAGSFLEGYDDAFYLDGLGICHGAAGLLLIADAFARHAGLPAAAELRAHLERYLLDHLDEAVASSAKDCSLLSGSSGALIASLTLSLGDRRWLPAIALR